MKCPYLWDGNGRWVNESWIPFLTGQWLTFKEIINDVITITDKEKRVEITIVVSQVISALYQGNRLLTVLKVQLSLLANWKRIRSPFRRKLKLKLIDHHVMNIETRQRRPAKSQKDMARSDMYSQDRQRN